MRAGDLSSLAELHVPVMCVCVNMQRWLALLSMNLKRTWVDCNSIDLLCCIGKH
jgi:hypothetical protein